MNLFAAAAVSLATVANGQIIITGVIDGPRTGGLPKAVELFVTQDIADLSGWTLSSANNGGAIPATPEFLLTGSATAGTFIYIASETAGFQAYFGFTPTFVSGAVNINGDDAIVLQLNGTVIDAFGTVGTAPAANNTWNYLDSYAYRNNFTSANPSFNIADWFIAGSDLLDAQGSTGVNGSAGITVPFGTYIPTPAAAALAAFAGVAAARRRR